MFDWLLNLHLQSSCDDYCLHVWEVVGIWLTGIATSAAVILSLVLARRSRPAFKISAGLRRLVGGGLVGEQAEDFPELLTITVRNVGYRSVVIQGVGWHRRGLRLLGVPPAHAYQTMTPQPTGVTLPVTIKDGESLSLYIPIEMVGDEEDWVSHLANAMLDKFPRLSVRRLRVTAWTPTGFTQEGRIERPLRERLLKAASGSQ